MIVKIKKKGKNYALEIKNKPQTFKIFWHWETEEIQLIKLCNNYLYRKYFRFLISEFILQAVSSTET